MESRYSGIVNYTSAILRLYIYNEPTVDVVLDARYVSGSWDESTITWNNKPANTSTVDDSYSFTTTEYNVWVELDITSLANAWFDSANNGLVLTPVVESGAANVDISAREHSDHVPQLVLTGAGVAEFRSPLFHGLFTGLLIVLPLLFIKKRGIL